MDAPKGYTELHGVGQNITGYISADSKSMLLEVQLDKVVKISSSGMSKILATTGGNLAIPTADCKIGVNVFRMLDKPVED